MKGYYFIKRQIDLWGSIFTLILLSPLFLITAVVIKLTSQGPVFFRQDRMGKDEAIFRIWKFRTMRVGADDVKASIEEVREWEANGDDPRLTFMGRWIRKFGIDEFPQFINVLKGDMSIVGPRPYYMPRIRDNESLKERLSVKPGFISLALVNGGVTLSDEEILRYDKEYIRIQSIGLDIKIMIKAVALALSGRGFN